METLKPRKKLSDETKNESVEVLYQKLGSRWFAFSLVENEVFVGSVDEQEVLEGKNIFPKSFRKNPRSS